MESSLVLNLFQHPIALNVTDSHDNSSPAVTGEIAEGVYNEVGYLIDHLGWRHRNRLESICLTIVYGVVLVTGIIGNVATCVVIATNGSMRTATNYYLFSLAVSDALTLVFGK